MTNEKTAVEKDLCEKAIDSLSTVLNQWLHDQPALEGDLELRKRVLFAVTAAALGWAANNCIVTRCIGIGPSETEFSEFARLTYRAADDAFRARHGLPSA